MGGRPPSTEGARERGHTRRCREGARVRGGGHRPLPHRAHVHGAGPAAGRAGDDHGRGRTRPARCARAAAADAAVRLRGDLRGDGRAAGHDSAARPAAARVSSRRGGCARRTDAPADPRAARVESDARDARLPPRAAMARGLRDASARDRSRGARRPRPNGCRPTGRDHAPPRRLRGGAPTSARVDGQRGRAGGSRRRVPLRNDDRAAARVHSCRRHRRPRGLLLVRDERSHADGARLLA